MRDGEMRKERSFQNLIYFIRIMVLIPIINGLLQDQNAI